MIQFTQSPFVVNLHYIRVFSQRRTQTHIHTSVVLPIVHTYKQASTWGEGSSNLWHCNGAKCFTSRRGITILPPLKDFLVARRNNLGLPLESIQFYPFHWESRIRKEERRGESDLFDVYSVVIIVIHTPFLSGINFTWIVSHKRSLRCITVYYRNMFELNKSNRFYFCPM